jgi:hypothetical protein
MAPAVTEFPKWDDSIKDAKLKAAYQVAAKEYAKALPVKKANMARDWTRKLADAKKAAAPAKTPAKAAEGAAPKPKVDSAAAPEFPPRDRFLKKGKKFLKEYDAAAKRYGEEKDPAKKAELARVWNGKLPKGGAKLNLKPPRKNAPKPKQHGKNAPQPKQLGETAVEQGVKKSTADAETGRAEGTPLQLAITKHFKDGMGPVPQAVLEYMVLEKDPEGKKFLADLKALESKNDPKALEAFKADWRGQVQGKLKEYLKAGQNPKELKDFLDGRGIDSKQVLGYFEDAYCRSGQATVPADKSAPAPKANEALAKTAENVKAAVSAQTAEESREKAGAAMDGSAAHQPIDDICPLVRSELAKFDPPGSVQGGLKSETPPVPNKEARPEDKSSLKKTLMRDAYAGAYGAVAGAALGLIFGGPIGMIIGGALGFVGMGAAMHLLHTTPWDKK